MPEPEGPTDDEILALSGKHFTYRGDSIGDRFVPVSIGPSIDLSVQMVAFARAILARYSHQRPKPLSLAKEALEAQQRLWDGKSTHDDWHLIRRALEKLQQLEDQQ